MRSRLFLVSVAPRVSTVFRQIECSATLDHLLYKEGFCKVHVLMEMEKALPYTPTETNVSSRGSIFLTT